MEPVEVSASSTAPAAATRGPGELEDDLHRSREQMHLLVEQVVDYAFIGLDTAGHIDFWTEGAHRLKGYAEAEAHGQHFSIFYPETDRAAGLPDQLLARALRDGCVQHSGWRLRADGSLFWGDVTITALRDREGRPAGFGKVTRDRTVDHENEMARQAFLGALAHDVRTPLTSIIAYAQMMEHGDIDAEAVPRIRGAAERVVQMIDDLHTHVREHRPGIPADPEDLSTAARLRPRPDPATRSAFDVLDAARHATEVLGGPFDLSRIVIGPGRHRVWSEPRALERILLNLVTNAIRYSEDTVEIDAGAEQDRVLVTVRDHGRGIAHEDLASITQPYVRGRLSTEDGGLGLGLSSVARLVEQLDGTLTIDSAVGLGTTVTVGLPAAPAGC